MSPLITPNPGSQRGSYLVWSALLVPVIAGFLALAIDIGLVLGHKRQAQIAADAAAIAGALSINASSTASEKQAAASTAGLEAAKDNGFNDLDSDVEVTVKIPPGPEQSLYYCDANAHIGCQATKGDYVAATITSRSPGIFSSLVNTNQFSITVHAVASGAVSSVTACPGVFTGRIDTPRGVNLQRGGFTITGGGIYVGDIHSQSIGGSGDGFMTADWIKLGGSNSGGITYTCTSNPPLCPETNVIPTQNPQWEEYDKDKCDYYNVVVTSTGPATCDPLPCIKPAPPVDPAIGGYRGLPAGYYCSTRADRKALTIRGANFRLRPSDPAAPNDPNSLNATNEVFVFQNGVLSIETSGSGGSAVKSNVLAVPNRLFTLYPDDPNARGGVALYAVDTSDLAYLDDPTYIAPAAYTGIYITGDSKGKSTLTGSMRIVADMIVLTDALLTMTVFNDVGSGGSFASCGEFGRSGLLQ